MNDYLASRQGALAFAHSTSIQKFIFNLAGISALATGITAVASDAARAQQIPGIEARIVATHIPGASAISQVGTFLNVPAHPLPPVTCGNPIPSKFPSYIQPGAVLDPNRILVGSRSNFGAPPGHWRGARGLVPFDRPERAQVFSKSRRTLRRAAISPQPLAAPCRCSARTAPIGTTVSTIPGANTASYTGVSNPLGLSNNNAFGRIWPANAPFGDSGVGSSSILDPTGLPLAGAPNPVIGGVYVGSLTNRNIVAVPAQPQVIPGSLSAGAVGTAFLGPSPDGSCKAVFSVVTADGAIVQEHTLKGLDGLAPAGTVQPLFGRSWDPPGHRVEPRLGVLMNPYTAPNAARNCL